jgi:hypothetical protein
MKAIISLLIFIFSSQLFATQTILLEGDNRDYKCSYRSTLLQGMKSPREFVKRINTLNLSVDCLAKDQRHFIVRTSKKVRGVTFGTHAAASKVVSVEGGMELVITIYDEETLMIGLVSYEGGGASVSLPVGASITKGALHGTCKTVYDYLGNFQTFSVLGMNKSYGTANELTHPHRTHCDSSSNTIGASMSVVGYAMTHYQQASQFYYLRGERVEELIEYITRYHPLD